MIKKLLNLFKLETVRYLFIGGCTTVFNFVVFAILYDLLGFGLNISNFISISASIIFAFITNKLFVFLDKKNSFGEIASELFKFVAGRTVTMLIEIFGVWFLVEFLTFNEYLSKFMIQIIVLISNYVISKFFVFKKTEE